MSAKRVIRIMDALTTRKGAAAAAAVLMAAGFTAWAGAPAQSTGATLQLAQANGGEKGTAQSSESGPFSAEQKQSIERIVKDYLIRNPEILIEVGRELEKRQAMQQAAEHKRFIIENRDKIFAAPTDFVIGNPNGDITVVEFFDYNCPWCKRALGELQKIVEADPKVKVILKEFPIFGENSTFTAKVAMAAQKQGKYFDLHVALMHERQVTKDNVFKIAEKVGLDVDRLKADMNDPAYEAAIKHNSEVAQALGIEGTPGFIVDTKVNVGFLPASGLTDLVNEARKSGCQIC